MKGLVERAMRWNDEVEWDRAEAPPRWASEPQLEELRGRWLRALRARWPHAPARMIERAVDEALALASCTVAPGLVFPLLAEEKATEVVAWHERQGRILERTWAFLAE